MQQKRPNVLLIMTDQMRGDCLGAAGHPDVKTPFLDTLCAQGTLFENAYTACPSCIPARAALMTGMSPRRNGRVGYQDGVEWTYQQMMPQVLSDAKYQTQCVGKLHVDPPRLGCGFQSVELHDGFLHYYRRAETPYHEHQYAADDYLQFLRERCGSQADLIDTGLECNSWVARPWPYDEMSHPTNWVVTRSIDFLRRRDRTRPFFLMASFVRPHPPFDAPEPFFEMYRHQNLRAPAAGDWDDLERRDGIQGRVTDSPCGSSDPELRRQAMIGYYACITHIDHQIGRLIQGLNQDGSLDDTLILFVSDHGELLFDHALFRKTYPYQGSVHVPMIVCPPKNMDAPRGQVRSDLCELRDVMPTVLEFAGAPIPAGVDGLSLMDAVRGGPGLERADLHGEHAGGEIANQWIVTRRDKLVWFSQSGREQYFDLEHDPREERNLIDDPACAERVALLRHRLIESLDGREEGYTDGTRLIPGRRSVAVLERPDSWREQ